MTELALGRLRIKFILRNRLDRNISFALLLASVWFLLVIVSPYLVAPGQLDDISGRVFFLDNQQKLNGVNPVASTVYSIGDFYCHQLSDRSYFLNGNQLPFCARDVGVFAGVVSGAIVSLMFAFDLRWRWLVVALLPIAIDGGIQSITGYDSTNGVRLITGAIAGMAIAGCICVRIAKPFLPSAEETAEINAP